MEIKRSQFSPWETVIRGVLHWLRARRLWAFVLYSMLVFSIGAAVFGSGLHAELLKKFEDNAAVLPKLPGNLWRGFVVVPERLTIDIRHEDFMRLAYQREIALARGVLEVTDEDYVPATISYNGDSVPARVRLKGDWLDHLNTDKWSLRIIVRGDETLFGMKQLSIQHPKTRNFIYEWIYHQALAREDVPSLRYKFLNVTLNGKDLGVYAVEEHFEKRLIENNRLREGPIVRFNENLLFAERFQQLYPFPGARTNGNRSYLVGDVDTFQTGDMFTDPVIYAQHTEAIRLLESFRRGDLITSEVFDVPKLARFLAVNDVLGAQHSTNWHNVRFYYNPVTSRLEPIGFDGDSGRPIQALSPWTEPVTQAGLVRTMFNDTLFYHEYVKELERISAHSYIDDLMAELRPDLDYNLAVIHSEFPYVDFSPEVFYRNQRYIETVLNPIKAVHAYFRQADDGMLELELGNIQGLPVEVLAVSYADSILFKPAEPRILPESTVLEDKPVDFQVVQFKAPSDFRWTDAMSQNLQVSYRLLGTDKVRQEAVFPWSYLGSPSNENDILRETANVDSFDFLTVDESQKEVVVSPGNWSLERNLIVPAGYKLIAGEETQIDLLKSAKIISFSPLELVGSAGQPIVITSSDATGQGLVVFNAEQFSVIESVHFRNLANPSEGNWELTGAVTFYESPVHLASVHFLNNTSEDALNIIRSDFDIVGAHFVGSAFDAVDIDFSEGSIRDASFIDIGNDAIDVSGAAIVIQDVRINGSGDKGISIGEMSYAEASRISITDSYIGVATKDLSELTARDIKISNSEFGLAIYQKKPEFGGAMITIEALEMTDVGLPYLVEKQSTLLVNDQPIEEFRDEVYQFLYPSP